MLLAVIIIHVARFIMNRMVLRLVYQLVQMWCRCCFALWVVVDLGGCSVAS